MLFKKNKSTSFSSVSESVLETNFLVHGADELKTLKLLGDFIINKGVKAEHSVSVCNPYEAEYLIRKGRKQWGDNQITLIDCARSTQNSAGDETLINPLLVFKAMIATVRQRATWGSADGDMWSARGVMMFTAMEPYIESVFTQFQDAPGVDVTDSKTRVMSVQDASLSDLKNAMTLPKIKAWLKLQKDSPHKERLYKRVQELPAFTDLDAIDEEELRNYGFLTMIGAEVLRELARYTAVFRAIEKAKKIIATRKGHVVLSIPETTDCESPLAQHIHAHFVAEIRNAIKAAIINGITASDNYRERSNSTGEDVRLSEDLQSMTDKLESLIELCQEIAPDVNETVPMFVPAHFFMGAGESDLLQLSEVSGVVFGVKAENDLSKEPGVESNVIYEQSKSHVILDQSAAIDFMSLSGKILEPLKRIASTTAVLFQPESGKCVLAEIHS